MRSSYEWKYLVMFSTVRNWPLSYSSDKPSVCVNIPCFGKDFVWEPDTLLCCVPSLVNTNKSVTLEDNKTNCGTLRGLVKDQTFPLVGKGAFPDITKWELLQIQFIRMHVYTLSLAKVHLRMMHCNMSSKNGSILGSLFCIYEQIKLQHLKILHLQGLLPSSPACHFQSC